MLGEYRRISQITIVTVSVLSNDYRTLKSGFLLSVLRLLILMHVATCVLHTIFLEVSVLSLSRPWHRLWIPHFFLFSL